MCLVPPATDSVEVWVVGLGGGARGGEGRKGEMEGGRERGRESIDVCMCMCINSCVRKGGYACVCLCMWANGYVCERERALVEVCAYVCVCKYTHTRANTPAYLRNIGNVSHFCLVVIENEWFDPHRRLLGPLRKNINKAWHKRYLQFGTPRIVALRHKIGDGLDFDVVVDVFDWMVGVKRLFDHVDLQIYVHVHVHVRVRVACVCAYVYVWCVCIWCVCVCARVCVRV